MFRFFLLNLTCKCPNSYIISYSCFTTGCSMLTKLQYLVLSSIMAVLSDRRSTSSSSAFCWLTVCMDESTRLWRLSDVPFFAFFCSRKVSLERFLSSLRHRLYSLVWSLSRITTWRFHSSSLSCARNGENWISELIKGFVQWSVGSKLPVEVLWDCPWWRWWTFSFVFRRLCVADKRASERFQSLLKRLWKNKRKLINEMKRCQKKLYK